MPADLSVADKPPASTAKLLMVFQAELLPHGPAHWEELFDRFEDVMAEPRNATILRKIDEY